MLTGMLSSHYGYYIRRSKYGLFSQRSKHAVPPDGHWRFILACAKLAKNGLHLSDIRLTAAELVAALREAGHFIASRHVLDHIANGTKLSYTATDIINLQTLFSL